MKLLQYKGLGDTTVVNAHTLEGVLCGLSDLGLFSSTAELSGFPEYQVTDERHSFAQL
jgi:hypothetical protein